VKRTAALARITVLGISVVVIAAGALGLYYYTLPTSTTGQVIGSTTTTTSQQSSTLGSDGRYYVAVQFNGTTYMSAVKLSNAPSFSCPTGTSPALCALLNQSCGNGVGGSAEPWKNCYNCPFDDGCTGVQTCDPYTHTCSALVSACQVAVYGPGNG
jgi:hypothetical protein